MKSLSSKSIVTLASSIALGHGLAACASDATKVSSPGGSEPGSAGAGEVSPPSDPALMVMSRVCTPDGCNHYTARERGGRRAR
jgi:hypothetical protein